MCEHTDPKLNALRIAHAQALVAYLTAVMHSCAPTTDHAADECRTTQAVLHLENVAAFVTESLDACDPAIDAALAGIERRTALDLAQMPTKGVN